MTDAGGVAETSLFEDLSGRYPEIDRWPAICTVYRGGYGTGNPTDAAELDLGIMRRCGDAFLDLKGITVCRFPVELEIPAGQTQEQGQSMC